MRSIVAAIVLGLIASCVPWSAPCDPLRGVVREKVIETGLRHGFL